LRWPVRLGVSLLLVSLGGVWVRECRLSMGSLRLQRGCVTDAYVTVKDYGIYFIYLFF
jgi:hypothetical protein